MSDFSCYVLHTNRPDLTKKALESVSDLGWRNIVVIDNSDKPSDFGPWQTIRPLVPLSAVQSINLCLIQGKRLKNDFVLWMHNDAEARTGSAMALATYARRMNAEQRKWGVLWTNYDAFSAVNLAAVEDVGLWDTNFTGYYGDNDYYRRMKIAGWECIDTCLPVDHVGSQTIKSDPERQFINDKVFPIFGSYYAAKWGGNPGHERFERPFGR
jgi:hypothetical protein